MKTEDTVDQELILKAAERANKLLLQIDLLGDDGAFPVLVASLLFSKVMAVMDIPPEKAYPFIQEQYGKYIAALGHCNCTHSDEDKGSSMN